MSNSSPIYVRGVVSKRNGNTNISISSIDEIFLGVNVGASARNTKDIGHITINKMSIDSDNNKFRISLNGIIVAEQSYNVRSKTFYDNKQLKKSVIDGKDYYSLEPLDTKDE